MEMEEVQTHNEAQMRPPSGNILRVGGILDTQRQQPILPKTILGAGKIDPFKAILSRRTLMFMSW
jgi:hypothetical protein